MKRPLHEVGREALTTPIKDDAHVDPSESILQPSPGEES